MSLNVLVIPEDFRKDQYILKPIVESMMVRVGVRSRVRVCQDPLLGGIGEALKWERLSEILERYRGMVRMFLLIVDRDGNADRRAALERLERLAHEALAETDRVFLAEAAWQEVEVWALAGATDLPKSWRWQDIRTELDPKERYFQVYAQSRGLAGGPYDGREVLGREAASRYARVRKLCPEDVERLETRVSTRLGL